MKYVDFFVVVLRVLPSKRTELGFQLRIGPGLRLTWNLQQSLSCQIADWIWCRFVKCPSKSFLCLNKASNVYIKCCSLINYILAVELKLIFSVLLQKLKVLCLQTDKWLFGLTFFFIFIFQPECVWCTLKKGLKASGISELLFGCWR